MGDKSTAFAFAVLLGGIGGCAYAVHSINASMYEPKVEVTGHDVTIKIRSPNHDVRFERKGLEQKMSIYGSYRLKTITDSDGDGKIDSYREGGYACNGGMIFNRAQEVWDHFLPKFKQLEEERREELRDSPHLYLRD